MSALCTNCGKLGARHSADEFPTVNLCYPCLRDFFEWIYDRGVADGNPIVAAFWYSPFTIVTQSPDRDNSWTYRNLKGFKIVPVNSS